MTREVSIQKAEKPDNKEKGRDKGERETSASNQMPEPVDECQTRC